MAGRLSRVQQEHEQHERSMSAGDQFNTRGRSSFRSRASSFRGGGGPRRASPIARGSYFTGNNDPTDLTGWKEKLEADRKKLRHDLIATFGRSGIYCRQQWQNGLVPVSKFVVQDTFETISRILKHHEDENEGRIFPEEEVCIEGLRSRAGSL